MKVTTLKNHTGTLIAKSVIAVGFIFMTACAPAPQDQINDEQINQSAFASGIIGGKDVAPQDPLSTSIVALYDVKSSNLCTGSILSDSIILTAAHCLAKDYRNLRVIFANDLMANNRVVRKVLGSVASRYWSTRSRETVDTGDIALVRFEGGLPKGYKPARLMTMVASLRAGQEVLLAGYGISNGVTGEGSATLRKTNVRIENPNYGRGEVRVDQRSGTGACHGDSGGPAYINLGGVNYLWGVTSRGSDDPNNDCSQFAIYTNAIAYGSWIQTESLRLNAIRVTTATKRN